MDLPKDMKITYRSFNGNHTVFSMDDESCYMILRFTDTGEGLRKISNSKYAWSCEIPVNWIETENHNGENIISFKDSDKLIQFELVVVKGVSLQEFREYYENSIKTTTATGLLRNVSTSTVNDKNTEVYKYDNKITVDEITTNLTVYIFEMNGNVYAVMLQLFEIYNNERNRAILNAIWESLRIE